MEWFDQLNARQRATAEKVKRAAQKWGVPEELALAAAMQESSMDQRKKSGTGPQGVMMMGRRASKEMGINPRNEDQNIEGGVRLLGKYLQKYGDPQTALIAYHDGPSSAYFKGGQASPEAIKHLQKVQSYGGFQGDIPTMAKKDELPFKITEVAPVEEVSFPDITQEPPQFFSRPLNIADYAGGAAGALAGGFKGANVPLSTKKEQVELTRQRLAQRQLEEARSAMPQAPKTFGQDIGNWVPGQYSEDIARNVRQPSSMEDAAEQARILEMKKKLAESKFGPVQQARPGSPIVILGNVPQVPGTSYPPMAPEPTLADMPASKITAGRGGWGRAGNVATGALYGGLAADAYQRMQQDDPIGAGLSAAGSVGFAGATHLPNPKARLLSGLVGAGFTGLGKGFDYFRDKYGIKPKEQESILEEKAAGGLTALPKYAGRAESLVNLGKSAKKALENVFTPRPTTVMRASEALAPHEGKYLGLTQSDNFGVHGGRMGGNQFPNFQNISPEHQKAGVVWMNDTRNHANALVQNRKFNDKDVVFSTFLGGPDQLKSNKTVFDDILEQHYKRNLTPEQYDLINNRIATVKDNKGRLVFPESFDIRDRFATQELAGDTFARRGALASMLGEGEGVNRTRGGIAMPEYQDILRSHRDPLTEGVPTSSVGTRLFTVDDIPAQFSKDYHPDYNWAVFGKDQGVQFNPVPQNIIVPDWYQAYKAKHPTREPHGNAWFSYMKSPQFIDDKYLTWLQKQGRKDGGLVRLGGGGNPKLAALKAFIDPVSKHLKDWNWRPMSDVAERLDLREVPDYIQGGYGQFMSDQASRAAKGELGPRDLIKAYGITQSSIGRGGLPYNTATKAGLRLPNTGGEVRPEGAFAEWLGSPMGQRFLDTATKGNPDPRALAEIQAQFAPFGKQNQLVDQLRYASQTMPELAKEINPAITGSKDAYRNWAEQMKGVAGAKSGFIGSMLGRGDLPTFDARQIGLHTGNEAPVGISSIMNRGKGTGGRESVDRLAARQEALGVDIDPSLAPYYQHLTHHAVWDKLGGNKTTHEDIIRAMRDYAGGGLVHLGGGGIPDAVVKAYKLFRTNKKTPGELYPLFVNKNTPVPVGEWVDAVEGPLTASGKVQSSLGELAYRPGWHAGDAPVATHIGGYTPEQKAEKARIMALRKQAIEERGITSKKDREAINKEFPLPEELTAPTVRPSNQVWAEVEMPADVDWQTIATQRGTNPEGKFVAGQAHITDQLPVGGHYRYKTNPNMTGDWLIGGSMKVNRVLSDEEVKAINDARGLADLPRMKAEGGLVYLASGGTPSLSVGRGEKLPVDQGAGLTAKGRAKYNRETGSNLKAPQPEGGPRKDSFCARMEGVVKHAKGDAPRAKASLKRWKC